MKIQSLFSKIAIFTVALLGSASGVHAAINDGQFILAGGGSTGGDEHFIYDASDGMLVTSVDHDANNKSTRALAWQNCSNLYASGMTQGGGKERFVFAFSGTTSTLQ